MTHKPSYKDLENRIRELEQSESLNRKSHEKFLTVLDSIDATIYVADMKTYEILFMNKHMIESFGRDMTGDLCFQSFRKAAAPCGFCTNEKLTDEKGLPSGVLVWQDKNPITDKFYINYDRAIEWTDGKLVRLQVATDITDQKKAEAALVESEKRYRNILESIEDGYFEVDLNGNLTFFNPSLCKILGYPSRTLMGMNNRQYMDQENAQKVFQTFHQVYTTGKAAQAFDWKLIRKDGSRRFVESSISLKLTKKGKPEGFQGIVRDITDRKLAEEELYRISIHDHLTSVYNRRYAFERLDVLIQEHQREKRHFSISIIDLDFFKTINDSYGHPAGDFILREFAAILTRNLRPYDLVSRYGGEEFIIITMNIDMPETRKLMTRLLQTINRHVFNYNGMDIRLTFSAGISNTLEFVEDISVEKLIRKADERLYLAKERGRNAIIDTGPEPGPV